MGKSYLESVYVLSAMQTIENNHHDHHHHHRGPPEPMRCVMVVTVVMVVAYCYGRRRDTCPR
jgi:hypothetical protein